MAAQVLDQATVGAFAVAALEYLKSTGWFPFLTAQSAKARKIVFGAVASAGSVLGITFAWNPAAHVFTVGNLSWAALGAGLLAWGKQYLLQEAVYRGHQLTSK
jgi:hypothetical protein